MMNRKQFMGAVAAVAALALAPVTASAQEQPKLNFKMATGWSGGPLMEIGAKAFAENVKRMSGGRIMAGSIFTGVFVAMGGMGLMRELIGGLSLGPWALLFLFLGLIFLAGFFLEWISIILIFVPIFMPFVTAAGFDPVWFCMLVLIMIQTSYLTPPMAPAIFYLRGVAPPEITLKDMYWGVVPFIMLQFLTAAIILSFPQVVLWLPAQVLGFR